MVEKIANAETLEAFSLRIPASLRERVRFSAVANRRSVNAQMLVLIEQALPAHIKEGEAA